MPKCPRCGFSASNLYKCDNCGDVRCNGGTTKGDTGACGTSKGPSGRAEPAVPNGVCRVCKKGKYRRI